MPPHGHMFVSRCQNLQPASCSLDCSGELAEHCQHRDDDDNPQEVIAVHCLQPAGGAGAGRAAAVSASALERMRAPSPAPCWLPACSAAGMKLHVLLRIQ